MKKAFAISAVCTLLFLFMTGSALAQCVVDCDCDRTVQQRLDTARDLLEADAGNYASRVDYYATDIIYKEPFLTNSGRGEMLEYLAAMYGGTAYGYPDDRVVEVKDVVTGIDDEGNWMYMATVEWSGSFDNQFYIQKGMSILKFRDGEGCPFYHRDYYTEGDTWWNIPEFKGWVTTMRKVYFGIMGLMGRCFDEDLDGYTKYRGTTGCAYPWWQVDCNDFVYELNRNCQ